MRSLTRVAQVYLTLVKGSSASEKPIRDHYSPLNNATPTTASDTATFQLILGARRFPEQPIDSIGEAYYRLRQATGVSYGESELSLTPQDYANRKFVVAWELEKAGAQNASHTGISTKGGEILTLEAKNTGLGSAGDYALITITYDMICSIRGDQGAEIFD